MDDHKIAPINPLPVVVWLLVLPMMAVEAALSLGELGAIGGARAVGWRVAAMEGYGFFPDYWRQQAQNGLFDVELLLRFFSYSFVHGAAVDTMFGVVLLLAVGKFVGEVFAGWAVAAVFFGSAAVGALVYGTFVQSQPLFGAFPAVYGLIGALSFLLLYGRGEQPTRAFALIGGLLAIQLIFGASFALLPMVFPSMGDAQASWTWVADLSGFATGFVLSYLVSPGGFARLRRRMLQR
ncbi:MAG: rhomboid family intramembrane serine protease [Cypionkella sp.]